jgi:hypothetical protein
METDGGASGRQSWHAPRWFFFSMVWLMRPASFHARLRKKLSGATAAVRSLFGATESQVGGWVGCLLVSLLL